VDPRPGPCKLCGGIARLFGVTDFNRSCEEVRGKFLPLLGVAIYYRRCDACGLVYTEAFDDWAPEAFETHIYNAAYGEVDPDYEVVRPAGNARLVGQMFAASCGQLSVLDYGGGNGALARDLRTAGFAGAETYDAFHPDHRARPDGRFDLVTCFETLEHMPDPVAGAADIASFLKPGGLILFSTLIQPADFRALRMQWWYAGPRNGHVTLHTRASLTTLWGRQGFNCGSFNDNLHVAYRAIPPFAAHLIRPEPAAAPTP
jgi:2-polyprenyl-6-hydroxyphenyl methylase/3-demethylubiquinone-9 3-methyltransferase